MSLSEPRESARLGDIEFKFKFPVLDVTTTGRKVEHEVLPTDGSGADGETVVQPLGSGKTTARLQGTVSRSEAQALDGIEGTVVALRHPRLSTDVFVSGIDTRSQESRRNGEKLYVFDADLIVIE
jgi:hypothetical protein